MRRFQFQHKKKRKKKKRRNLVDFLKRMLETNRRIPGINYHCNACTYRKGYFFVKGKLSYWLLFFHAMDNTLQIQAGKSITEQIHKLLGKLGSKPVQTLPQCRTYSNDKMQLSTRQEANGVFILAGGQCSHFTILFFKGKLSILS